MKDALTVKRSTYRNLGWCTTLKKIVNLGLVDETTQSDLKGVTFKKMTADLVGCPADGNVREATAKKLGIAADSEIINHLEWLGPFSDEPVPAFDNRLDILSQRLQEKLFFKEGEKDMLVLRHRFIVENKDNPRPDHLHPDRLRHSLRRFLHGPHGQPAHRHRHAPDRRGAHRHEGSADPGACRDLRRHSSPAPSS